jgi:DNA-binding response OmpR family regulator
LTKTEAKIFGVLFENHDTVVEYKELRKNLWPDGKDQNMEDPDHTIDVHVTNMRKKLTSIKNLQIVFEGFGHKLIWTS